VRPERGTKPPGAGLRRKSGQSATTPAWEESLKNEDIEKGPLTSQRYDQSAVISHQNTTPMQDKTEKRYDGSLSGNTMSIKSVTPQRG
jgi:hypothetical protein